METTTGVLITGGFGFIGSNLTEHYLKLQIPVLCVDNLSTGYYPNKTRLDETYKGLLTTVEKDVVLPWEPWLASVPLSLLNKISHVFFLSSPASPRYFSEKSLDILFVNSLGLKNALDFSRKFGARLVFSSTSEIYGCEDKMPLREDCWGKVNVRGERSCYEEGKRFGESLVYNFNKTHKTRHGVVRIFNTYGPGMSPNDGRVVINFLKQAFLENTLTIFGDGEQTRSLCYIDDLIGALTAYGESNLIEPMNIGNDHEITVTQLAQAVVKMMATESREVEILYKNEIQDEPRYRRPDLSLAIEKLYPWKPKVGLQEGLQRTKEWLKKELRHV